MTETDLLAAAYPGHLSPPDYEFATNILRTCGTAQPSGGGTGSGGRRPGALLLFLPT